jgi:hypothetical protein
MVSYRSIRHIEEQFNNSYQHQNNLIEGFGNTSRRVAPVFMSEDNREYNAEFDSILMSNQEKTVGGESASTDPYNQKII